MNSSLPNTIVSQLNDCELNPIDTQIIEIFIKKTINNEQSPAPLCFLGKGANGKNVLSNLIKEYIYDNNPNNNLIIDHDNHKIHELLLFNNNNIIITHENNIYTDIPNNVHVIRFNKKFN